MLATEHLKKKKRGGDEVWRGSQGTMISIHREMTGQEGRSQSSLSLCLPPFTLSKPTICLSAFIKLELIDDACKSTLALEHMVLQMISSVYCQRFLL